MTTFKSLPAITTRSEFSIESFKRCVKHKKIIPLAWDTETDGLGGELLCATYSTPDTSKIISGDANFICEEMLKVFSKQCLPEYAPDFIEYGITNDNEFSDIFKDKSDPLFSASYPVWYAHNAGYDLRYFIDYMLKFQSDNYKLEIGMRTQTDIYEVKVISLIPEERWYDARMNIHAKTFVIRDSMAIFPTSLKKFTQQFAITQKSTKGPDFEQGETFNCQNLNHTRYAIDDAISLREAMTSYQEIVISDYSVPLSATAAGTAMKAWKATLAKNEEYFITESNIEDYIRKAYFGGLVFLTDTNIHKNAKTVDINSSYPANMRAHAMPDGRFIHVDSYVSATEKLGIFTVKMRAPEDLIVPVLPHRNESGLVCWHGGEFTTTITNVDIDSAIRYGYTLLEVHDGIVFEDLAYPFKDFIDKAEQIRLKNKGTARETVAKQMQNSLYGKFGSSKIRSAIFHPVDDLDYNNALPLSTDCAPIDSYFWIRKEFKQDMPVKIEWACFITAYARRSLLDTIYSVGPEKCIYGDTDSITMTDDVDITLVDIGNSYGQFKLEKTWNEFRALGPKLYTGMHTGEMHGAAKGLTRSQMTSEKWTELLNTGKTTTHTLQLDNLKAVMKKGIIELAKTATRKSSTLENSASYELLDNGYVRPKFSTHIILDMKKKVA